MAVTDYASTPYRKTSIEFDVPEAVSLRPYWGMRRLGNQMGIAGQQGLEYATNVARLPSGAWTLRPFQLNWSWETIALNSGVIGLLEVLAITYIQEKRLQRAPDLPGLTIDAGVAATGNVFLAKEVPAGGSWDLELDADAAAYSKPDLPSVNIPMRRVVASTTTFPADQAFCARFITPSTRAHAHDALCTFYFGGDTDVYPTFVGGVRNYGGAFCASFLGDGTCLLFERGREVIGIRTWTLVQEFRYSSQGKVAGEVHSIFFVPHPRAMDIFTETSDHANAAGLSWGPRLTGRNIINTAVYTTHRGVVGYSLKRSMTGAGPVRGDMREDLRLLFQPSRMLYPHIGILVDQPFVIPFPLPSDASIRVTMAASIPALTTLSVQLFDAYTGVALGVNLDGSFAPNPGQNTYYAAFTLTSNNHWVDAAYLSTPFLYGYEVSVPGATEDRTQVAYTGGTATSISITGPTSDPTLETAHATIEDLKNEIPALRYRGRIHTRIKTQYDQADPTKKAVLFEGEITRATGLRKGKTGRAYPDPDWRSYDCPMVSMWARNQDQIYFGMYQDFANDPAAGLLPDGSGVPWKITDIVREVFSGALGVPADMLDVPDLPLRAFISGTDAFEYALQPTASLMDYLRRLVKDHLGYHLIWDANATGDAAKKRGMWRLRPPTSNTADPIWKFVTTHPGVGRTPQHPGAYPSITSFIRSYTSYVRPPECNYVVVTTIGQMLPGREGSTAQTAFAYNPNSYNFDGSRTLDTSHPDYLGRFVPYIYYTTNLLGSDKWGDELRFNTNWICRRIYEFAAHAQKWVRFSAPLVLVTDAADTYLNLGNVKRPLRYYDPIWIDGDLFFVQSVQTRIRKDHVQEMEVEAMAAANTLIA